MEKRKRPASTFPVVRTYERSSTVRMAIGRAVPAAPWRDLFRLLSKRMTSLTWTASRAFNHFVLLRFF